jgi:PepSY-associated TM region
MMHLLTLLHRWLGVLFCLLFAMWFATGIVMHFVPFPALTEVERIGGLAPVEPSKVLRSPAEALQAGAIPGATRLRLFERVDGPVYVAAGVSGLAALRADDLSSAKVLSEQLALAIAGDHARRRALDATQATFAELAAYDQWTVPNALDRHRPLYRIALNDRSRTELYVSSTTGEVVRDTTRSERWWNYAGSVAHWIYPAVLRSRARLWDATVWTLSLAALIAAISGALLGTLRIKVDHYRLVSPFRGWQAWHHALGLGCMTFVLTWSFSGWLSMDNGRLFSTGRLTGAETAMASGAARDFQPTRDLQGISAQAREVEWFIFGGRSYRRERTGLTSQHLLSGDLGADKPATLRQFLEPGEIDAFAKGLRPACEPAVVIDAKDDYAIAASIPDGPVYRIVCGDVWFHIDGASGAMLERLDQSRRVYRWLYGALHTMDVPALLARPKLRTALIVILCGCGFMFSLTGVVIGWRRLVP